MDGSKPISGGLSHCWPQFGPGEIQQHGFARNVNWSVKSMTDTTVELEIIETDPSIKGGSATARTKPAKLVTGLTIQVPEHISTGDVIKINVEERKFTGRA